MAMIREGLQNRERLYDAFRPMAADYPVFGTGPGTWESVSQLYRTSMATELACATAQRLAGNAHHLRLGRQRVDRLGIRDGAAALVCARRDSRRQAFCLLDVAGARGAA